LSYGLNYPRQISQQPALMQPVSNIPYSTSIPYSTQPVRAAPIISQPTYVQPAAAIISQPTYVQPTVVQPTYTRPTYQVRPATTTACDQASQCSCDEACIIRGDCCFDFCAFCVSV
jgi:hypothetical protein